MTAINCRIIALLSLLLSLPADAAPHPDWQVSTVVSDLNIGAYHSLALDPGGQPLISFVDTAARQLKLTRFNGTSWTREVIDPGDGSNQIGNYNSLRLAPDGNPAVAYRRRSNDLLHYAKFNGTTWDITAIPDSGTNPAWSDLAFSATGHPAIGYKSNNLLAYAAYNGSSWAVTPDVDFDSLTGNNASLAFDSSGKPAMAAWRSASNQVRFVQFGNTSWGVVATVASLSLSSTADPSLAFSPAGNPALAYRDLGGGKLKYAEKISGSWVIEDVDDMAVVGLSECCELAFNPLTGKPSIAYTDPVAKDLKFAVKGPSGWDITVVDPDGDTGQYPKLDFTSTGRAYISYLIFNGGSDSDLKIATLPPPPLTYTTFGNTSKYAWAPNAGWISFRHDQPSSPAGAIVGEYFLSGEAWAPNLGWIYLGDGSPDNGSSYSNTSSGDYGVNRSPDGQLQGRAWAPNIGWIHFDAAKGAPRINLLTGAFEGQAWAPNLGWIHLGTGLLTTNSLDNRDSDNDGIADDWETSSFGNLTTATSDSDGDGDGISDLDEYNAGTDPNDPGSWLRIVSQSHAGDRTSTTLEFTSTPARLYRLHTSTDLDIWTDDTQHNFFTGESGTTTKTITHSAGTQLFFRVSARPPLTNG